MDAFKEFEGKSLDEAIREACNYYNTSREKLEIDIIQDAKSGIFGLVGARKAKVKARRVQLRATVENILGRAKSPAGSEEISGRESDEAAPAEARDEAPRGKDQENRERERKPRPAEAPRAGRPAQEAQKQKQKPVKGEGRPRPALEAEARAGQDDEGRKPHDHEARKGRDNEKTEGEGRKGREAGHGDDAPRKGREAGEDGGRRGRPDAVHEGEARESRKGDRHHDGESRRGRDREDSASRPRGRREAQAPRESAIAPAINDFMEEMEQEGLPAMRLDDVDVEKLCELCVSTVDRLVAPIIGQTKLEADIVDGRVNVSIDCGEDSGLLIGREGQTLASLQFLASRIVSQSMGFIVRVQLDAGEYRLRQYEKLRELALSLAEKVRAVGKSFSTRPMSSYHRRIIHMTLQDHPDVQTRSTGEGPLKRVVVQRRKN